MSNAKQKKHLISIGTQVLAPVIAVVALFILWEVMVRALDIKEFLLPAPSRIIEECWKIPGNLAMHAGATLQTVCVGFLLSLLLSFPLALMISSSQTMANIIYPVLVLTQSIPKIALAPILVAMLGTNELPRLVVTFLVAFFPLVISISTGLMSVPPDLIDLSKAYKASRLEQLIHIRIPYATPFIFSGLKVAVALSVVGAVTAEFVNADKGLGYLIVTSTAFFNVPVAFGAVIILSVIGILLFQAMVLTEKLFFPWSAAAQERSKGH